MKSVANIFKCVRKHEFFFSKTASFSRQNKTVVSNIVLLMIKNIIKMIFLILKLKEYKNFITVSIPIIKQKDKTNAFQYSVKHFRYVKPKTLSCYGNTNIHYIITHNWKNFKWHTQLTKLI